MPLYCNTLLRVLIVQIHINGFMQDCSISSAFTLEILQSCTKPINMFTIGVKYDIQWHNMGLFVLVIHLFISRLQWVKATNHESGSQHSQFILDTLYYVIYMIHGYCPYGPHTPIILNVYTSGWSYSYEPFPLLFVLWQTSLDAIDGKSTLAQSMAWCYQAKSH